MDGAEAHLDFDPSVLQVTGIVSGGILPLVLQNTWDNTSGTIDFSAGTLSSAPTGTFTLATVTFNPVAIAIPDTSVKFSLFLPRESNVVFGGSSVLDHTEIAKYTIRNDAIMQGSIGLQGRPSPPHARWVTPLTVNLVDFRGGHLFVHDYHG